MKTVHDCFYPNLFLPTPAKGEIGIEIETEVLKEDDYPEGKIVKQFDDEDGETWWSIPESQYWKGVYDGSLRNYGVEYVLKEPQDFIDSMVALDEFGSIFKDVPFLKDQPGTSVHVHLNFLNRPLVAVANFITVFTLYENLLTEYAGATRRSNLFARPHRVADSQQGNVLSLFKQVVDGKKTALTWNEHHVKYANLNIATLGRLGSLEVRCFRGTTDVLEIQRWVSILYDLYVFACKLSSPMEFYRLYQQNVDETIKLVFPNTYEYLTKPLYWRGLVHTNEFYMAKYALAVKDWSTFDEAYKPARPSMFSKKRGLVSDEMINLTTQPSVIAHEPNWGVMSSPAYTLDDDQPDAGGSF